MELQRQEYPAMLQHLQPSSAVTVLRERLRRIQDVNAQMADWMAERKKAEDAYVAALNKLARKGIPSNDIDLGHFGEPWGKLTSSTLELATQHQKFANAIEQQVERPIREFVATHKDFPQMKTIEANLTALAKQVDAAEEKSEKIKKRGARANVAKVSEVASQVEKTVADWESQAPFIFERLQAVDESRLNHLRDSLTQFHTLENDCATKAVQISQECLTNILDFKTEEEIKAFATRITRERGGRAERTRSRGTGAVGGMPSTPSIVTDDSVSVQSAGSGGAPSSERNHGGLHGLRRLGTVLKGRSKRTEPYQRAHSPENSKARSSERLSTPKSGTHPITPASPMNDFLSVNNSPRTESRGNERASSTPSLVPPSTANTLDIPKQNGHSPSGSPKNSMESAQPPMTVPILPNINAVNEPPKTDSEGFSIPPPNTHDSIGGFSLDDQQPADDHTPQFKVEIRNDVIHEEEEEADAALSKVASTLRAQNTVTRKNRGRRDASQVRNTMFFSAPPQLPRPESPVSSSLASIAMSNTGSDAGTAMSSGSPPLTPMRMPRAPTFTPSEAGSDTQSIRSARSITSLAGATIKHPDLHEPGLSASLIQALSISFEKGVPTKSVVIGEVAFAYNPPTTPLLSADGPSASPLPTVPLSQLLRIQNFESLEKISPNPALLTATSTAGEYSLSTASLPALKPSLALRFQLHLPQNPPASLAPILLSPLWKLEPHQASLILTYKRNPACTLPNPLVLRNVIFVTGVEGAKCSNCQSKPVGTFSREKGRLAWKFPELVLSETNQTGKLIARWTTEGLVRVAPVEMKWEVEGVWTPSENKENIAEGGQEEEFGVLGVEVWDKKEEEVDPFADEGEKEKEEWREVRTERRVVSGKYIAV